jgi:hypothetical protein
MQSAATNDDQPIPTEAASGLLKRIGYPVEPATLAVKRVRGGGPVYLKAGRRVLYKPSDLMAWAASNTRVLANTSEAA